MAGRQSALAVLLYLVLAAWSVEAAVIKQGALSQTKGVRGSKIEATDDDNDDTADDTANDSDNNGSEEDDSDDDDDDAKKKDDDDAKKKDDDDAKKKDDDDDDKKKVPVETDNSDEEAEEAARAAEEAVKATDSEKVPVALSQISIKGKDEDKDEDTTASSQLPPAVVAAPAPAAAAPVGPHAAEEAELRKEVQLAAEALTDNQNKQLELKQRIDHLSDENKSGQEIDATAKLVANETSSEALGGMLGTMWKEMRMFDVPLYAEHVQEELEHLKKDQKVLKTKLKSAKENLSAAQKAWAKGEEFKPSKPSEDGEEEGEEEKQESNDTVTNKTVDEKNPWEQNVDQHEKMLDGGVNDVQSGKFNFWAASAKEKDNYLAGTLVYLVGGICLAYLHNKARDRNPKIFAAEPTHEVSRSSSSLGCGYSFGIFGCFSAPNVCVMGCCCPCLTWADTMDKKGFLSYWKAFFAFFLLTVLYGFTWGIAPILVVVLGTIYRQKLRKSYDIENGTFKTVALDVLAWLCCQPCAIIQEAREESVMLDSP